MPFGGLKSGDTNASNCMGYFFSGGPRSAVGGLWFAMIRIKICGITNLEDALLAADLGADAVGFIFYPGSPRAVDAETVKSITDKLPLFLTRVGVFVDENPVEIRRVADYCHLDLAQLHGNESPAFASNPGINVIKSFRLKGAEDLDVLPEYSASSYAFLLDTYHPDKMGGTGQTFNWDWARAAKKAGRPIILSGGLTPENVAEAIRQAEPDAVDISSGVEASPGKKDPYKLARFIEAARSEP